MFDELVESSVVKKKTNKGWTIFISTVIQVGILVVMILIPLIYTQALPKAMLATMLTAPPPPPPPPPPPAAQAAPVKIVKPVARLIQNGQLIQPRAIPKQVSLIKEEALPPEISTGGSGFGVPGGVDGGVLGGTLGSALSSAAPPPPPKAAPKIIKQGGNVTSASLINQIQPTYPPLARQARISGSVVLHAIIDTDGRVTELSVISGHPLLVQSALEAVRQWRYKPTTLNGDAVQVDTTITVTFQLGG